MALILRTMLDTIMHTQWPHGNYLLLVGSTMAEIDDSVSYLRAMKESSSSHESTAAAPAQLSANNNHSGPESSAANLSANPADRFKGADKRRSTRYKCEGSAGIRAEGTDVQTWASFTDVSLHGCYVEAQATYPVGTVLHLKLEAKGVRLESKGIVRVSYPYLGMGISFLQVSDETREHLKELLGSVSRSSVIMGPGITSSIPARGPLDVLPTIADPAAAVEALIEFFESRQMLMREDFLRILRETQSPPAKVVRV